MGSSTSSHSSQGTKTNNNGQVDVGHTRSLKHCHVNVKDSHSKNLHLSVSPEKIKVLKLKCGIDKKLTSIDERSSAVLKYRTPHFRAVSIVEVPPLLDGQAVQIGWIQTCTEMQFINTYGKEGVTSWEFPEIVLGKYKMISDADGKQYPWYGLRNETQTIRGPSARQNITVHMNDNFFPQVTWYVPYTKYDRKPRLTHIYREQSFYTFLVAKDLANDRHHILKTVSWNMKLVIDVNPDNPLGQRATVLGPIEQQQPIVLDKNDVTLEKYALRPPNANNSQTLVWRPGHGEPKVIVPPLETTIDIDKYLIATKDFIHENLVLQPES